MRASFNKVLQELVWLSGDWGYQGQYKAQWQFLLNNLPKLVFS